MLRDKADETKKGITFVENRRDVFVPYGQVHAEAVAAATRLAEAGIGPGDRVIFQVSENRGLIRAFWGCVYAGAVPALAPPVSGLVDVDRVRTLSDMMPGAPILVDERSHTLLTGANGAVVVGEDRLLDVSIVNDAAVEPGAAMPGDAETDFSQAGEVDSGDGAGTVPAFPVRGGTAGEALIQFSSGSTGSPKGVIVTNESVLNGLRDDPTPRAPVREQDAHVAAFDPQPFADRLPRLRPFSWVRPGVAAGFRGGSRSPEVVRGRDQAPAETTVVRATGPGSYKMTAAIAAATVVAVAGKPVAPGCRDLVGHPRLLEPVLAFARDAGIHIEVPHDNPTTGPLPTAAHCDTKEKGKR